MDLKLASSFMMRFDVYLLLFVIYSYIRILDQKFLTEHHVSHLKHVFMYLFHTESCLFG